MNTTLDFTCPYADILAACKKAGIDEGRAASIYALAPTGLRQIEVAVTCLAHRTYRWQARVAMLMTPSAGAITDKGYTGHAPSADAARDAAADAVIAHLKTLV